MFSKLFAPKKPDPIALVLNAINEVRAKHGQSPRQPLPTSYGTNPAFVGTLLGMMEVMCDRTGEASFVITNSRDLFQKLWGLKPDRESWSDGMAAANSLLERGGNNHQLMSAIESTQFLMLESTNIERDLFNHLSKFF